MSVVSSDFGNLFFVTLDTPVSSNVVSVNEALLVLFRLRVDESGRESADYELPGDVHW